MWNGSGSAFLNKYYPDDKFMNLNQNLFVCTIVIYSLVTCVVRDITPFTHDILKYTICRARIIVNIQNCLGEDSTVDKFDFF